jgi:predicted amidohydrolase YtcJ
MSVGAIRQTVSFTGGPEIAASLPSGFSRGPVKIVVGDHDLPSLELLVDAVNTARAHSRNVAFHCVTTTALALIIATMREVGASQLKHLDRIEHAAVVPDEYVDELKQLRLVVVTQPGFVHTRGDRYLRTVDPVDLPFLYRCGSLVAAGISVYGSSDAPYGPVDPWLAMRTAIERRSVTGAVVGKDESISALSALRAYVNSPQEPWRDEVGPRVGDPGDLVILGKSLKSSLSHLDSESVRATVIGGNLVFSRD